MYDSQEIESAVKIQKTPVTKIKDLKLAATYSPTKGSTIGARGLNFRVRNGNGWTPTAKPPTLNLQ